MGEEVDGAVEVDGELAGCETDGGGQVSDGADGGFGQGKARQPQGRPPFLQHFADSLMPSHLGCEVELTQFAGERRGFEDERRTQSLCSKAQQQILGAAPADAEEDLDIGAGEPVGALVEVGEDLRKALKPLDGAGNWGPLASSLRYCAFVQQLETA